MGKNPYAGTQTEKNLEAAFAGESQARNKYTYFASVAKKFLKEDGRALIAMDSRDLHDELIIINDESLLYETKGDWKNWSLSQLEERLIEDERIYKQYLKQIKIKQIMHEGETLLKL